MCPMNMATTHHQALLARKQTIYSAAIIVLSACISNYSQAACYATKQQLGIHTEHINGQVYYGFLYLTEGEEYG